MPFSSLIATLLKINNLLVVETLSPKSSQVLLYFSLLDLFQQFYFFSFYISKIIFCVALVEDENFFLYNHSSSIAFLFNEKPYRYS